MDSLRENILKLHIVNENLNILQEMIYEGTDVNMEDKDGMTPLQTAAAYGCNKVIKLLVNNNAQIDKANDLGWTPLMHAARNGHSSTVEKLIKYGADVNLKNGFGTGVMCLAVASGSCRTVKHVMKAVSQESCHQGPITPLIVAVLFEHSNLIKVVLEFCSPQISVMDTGMTALMMAALKCNTAITDSILPHVVDSMQYNVLGQSALDIAHLKRNVTFLQTYQKHIQKYGDNKQQLNKFCEKKLQFQQELNNLQMIEGTDRAYTQTYTENLEHSPPSKCNPYIPPSTPICKCSHLHKLPNVFLDTIFCNEEMNCYNPCELTDSVSNKAPDSKYLSQHTNTIHSTPNFSLTGTPACQIQNENFPNLYQRRGKVSSLRVFIPQTCTLSTVNSPTFINSLKPTNVSNNSINSLNQSDENFYSNQMSINGKQFASEITSNLPSNDHSVLHHGSNEFICNNTKIPSVFTSDNIAGENFNSPDEFNAGPFKFCSSGHTLLEKDYTNQQSPSHDSKKDNFRNSRHCITNININGDCPVENNQFENISKPQSGRYKSIISIQSSENSSNLSSQKNMLLEPYISRVYIRDSTSPPVEIGDRGKEDGPNLSTHITRYHVNLDTKNSAVKMQTEQSVKEFQTNEVENDCHDPNSNVSDKGLSNTKLQPTSHKTMQKKYNYSDNLNFTRNIANDNRDVYDSTFEITGPNIHIKSNNSSQMNGSKVNSSSPKIYVPVSHNSGKLFSEHFNPTLCISSPPNPNIYISYDYNQMKQSQSTPTTCDYQELNKVSSPSSPVICISFDSKDLNPGLTK